MVSPMNHLPALSSGLRRTAVALGLAVTLVAMLSWPTPPVGASPSSSRMALAGSLQVADPSILRDPGGPGYPSVTPTPSPSPPYPTGPYATPAANYPPATPAPTSPPYASPADCPPATPTPGSPLSSPPSTSPYPPPYPGGLDPTPTAIGATSQASPPYPPNSAGSPSCPPNQGLPTGPGGSPANSGPVSTGAPMPGGATGLPDQDPCYGDEQITFSPENPRAGNDVLIAVSSHGPHPYGRLAGTERVTFSRQAAGAVGLRLGVDAHPHLAGRS